MAYMSLFLQIMALTPRMSSDEAKPALYAGYGRKRHRREVCSAAAPRKISGKWPYFNRNASTTPPAASNGRLSFALSPSLSNLTIWSLLSFDRSLGGAAAGSLAGLLPFAVLFVSSFDSNLQDPLLLKITTFCVISQPKASYFA